MLHLNFIRRLRKETQSTNNLSTTIYYILVRMEFDMSYLFFKDINREEFDEFVKKMNIVIYYKAIIGQK